MDTPLIGEVRLSKHGYPARVMVAAEGWLMVRHRGAIPFVEYQKNWMERPLIRQGRAKRKETTDGKR